MILSPKQIHAIANALHVAKEVYRRDAIICPELAEQYTAQANEAEALSEQFEQADGGELRL